MGDAFCSGQGAVGLATDITLLAFLGLSAWLVLRTGRISLGQQAFFALGAYAAGLATTLGHWPLLPALVAGAVLGALASAAVAQGTARLSGLHYAVATLALAELVRLGLSAWRLRVPAAQGGLVGPDGVDGFRGIRWLLENHVTPEEFLVLSLAALGAVLLALALLARTRLGLAVRAIGLDDTLSDACGLPLHRLRVAAAAAAGAVAGLGGGLHAHRLTYLDPSVFDPMLGVHAVGYAMVGGLATALGPLLGAAIDLGLLEAMRLFAEWRMAAFGALVALFLRWRPRGLLDEAMVHRIHLGLRRLARSFAPATFQR